MVDSTVAQRPYC